MVARGKSKKKQQPKAKPAEKSGPSRRRDASSGLVLLTILAVCVTTAVGVPFLAPLIVAAPAIYHLATRPEARGRAGALLLLRRWGLTVLIMTAASGGFVTVRTFNGIPWGAGVPDAIDAWMAGGGVPLGLSAIAVTAIAFVVVALASRGYAAPVVLAAAIQLNALHAVYLASKGYNLVLMALVAISPWQWCVLVGVVFLFPPLRAASRHRFGGGAAGSAFSWNVQRRDVYIGAGLLVAALILRIAVAGAYASLVREWTVF